MSLPDQALCAGVPARAWHGVALDGGLGEHAKAWDALNRQQFKDHPLLDSRLWNGLLRQVTGRRIELWVLQEGPRVLALCLLELLAWGVWRTFNPPQAAIAPVPSTTPPCSTACCSACGRARAAWT